MSLPTCITVLLCAKLAMYGCPSLPIYVVNARKSITWPESLHVLLLFCRRWLICDVTSRRHRRTRNVRLLDNWIKKHLYFHIHKYSGVDTVTHNCRASVWLNMVIRIFENAFCMYIVAFLNNTKFGHYMCPFQIP